MNATTPFMEMNQKDLLASMELGNGYSHEKAEVALNEYFLTFNKYLSSFIGTVSPDFLGVHQQIKEGGGMPDWAKSFIEMFTSPSSQFNFGLGSSIRGVCSTPEAGINEFDIRINEGRFDGKQRAPGEVNVNIFQDRIKLPTDEKDRFPKPEEKVDLFLNAPSSETPEGQRKIELLIRKGDLEYMLEYPPKTIS